MSDINALIDEQVKNNDVFLYMKGTPDFPMCGFSGRVVQILNYLGVEYDSANVLENQELREGIKAYTNWPTSFPGQTMPRPLRSLQKLERVT